ncbi:hypothetical protein [Streptomyces sp. NPDC049040]|uniref:hypothetical protein n=1 Tax=Streptomyces sp. NPDC049040 TaxID=3365593 RepID=UPI00371E4182
MIPVPVAVGTILGRSIRRSLTGRRLAAAHGLVPPSRLDIRRPGPDPEADAVLDAAAGGDWQRAADYLAQTGAEDWDVRWYRAQRLGDTAARDASWLAAWRAARPDDPGAALVYGAGMVRHAFIVRGGRFADSTSGDRLAGFRRGLERALPACTEAARLAADDPTPWVARISVAYGLGWPHDRFAELWSEITARDPHHYGAHDRALQYWSAKWRGSHRLMTGFADEAAASAPRGSLLPVLPLLARCEEESMGAEDVWVRPDVAAAIGAALDAVAAAPATHHRLPVARHVLAYALTQTDRYAEATEQFRAIGGYAGAVPWTYRPDPRMEFARVRATAFTRWAKARRSAPAA